MNREQKIKANKAAGLYIEMRGFKSLEQNWSQGRNKIDIIASKNEAIYFIEVSVVNNSLPADNINLSPSKLNKIKNAGDAWIIENKWPGSFNYSSILLDENYAVLSFNESLDY